MGAFLLCGCVLSNYKVEFVISDEFILTELPQFQTLIYLCSECDCTGSVSVRPGYKWNLITPVVVLYCSWRNKHLSICYLASALSLKGQNTNPKISAQWSCEEISVWPSYVQTLKAIWHLNSFVWGLAAHTVCEQSSGRCAWNTPRKIWSPFVLPEWMTSFKYYTVVCLWNVCIYEKKVKVLDRSSN